MHAAQHRVGCTGAQEPVHFVGILSSSLFIGAVPVYPSAPFWTERDARWATRGARYQWLADGSGDPTCTPKAVDEGISLPGARALRSGLWRVSSYGAAVVRDFGDGLSLTAQQLNGNVPLPAGIPANARVQHPAPLVINVKISDTQARQVQIDAGQTIFVYADDVSVSWSAPGPGIPLPLSAEQGWMDLGGNGETRVEFPFSPPEIQLIEGLLYVDIARVETSREQGQNFAKLTQTWQALAATRVIVPIPPGARRVQITRDPSGAVVAGTWEVGFSNGTTFGPAIGSLSSGSAVVPRVGFEAFQLNATHLQSPVIVEDHTWSIVWEIAP